MCARFYIYIQDWVFGPHEDQHQQGKMPKSDMGGYLPARSTIYLAFPTGSHWGSFSVTVPGLAR